ncbi:MAG: hypothetical protein Q8K07_14325 [Methylicorpusculum sp.]|uniref:hypothetical protein n=1 Tax=Methylicorpusculum sp. TaxID=2713644 RepID=UPI0027311EFB|nr:hypothetical protein [Methylicorpusculum sp.]MDP2203197.1 hypothetical protein [Methylicorpusculum sp.]
MFQTVGYWKGIRIEQGDEVSVASNYRSIIRGSKTAIDVEHHRTKLTKHSPSVTGLNCMFYDGNIAAIR